MRAYLKAAFVLAIWIVGLVVSGTCLLVGLWGFWMVMSDLLGRILK